MLITCLNCSSNVQSCWLPDVFEPPTPLAEFGVDGCGVLGDPPKAMEDESGPLKLLGLKLGWFCCIWSLFCASAAIACTDRLKISTYSHCITHKKWTASRLINQKYFISQWISTLPHSFNVSFIWLCGGKINQV